MKNEKTETSIAAISAQLTSLSNMRSMWEAGSYKQSNDELYDILTRFIHCGRLYVLAGVA